MGPTQKPIHALRRTASIASTVRRSIRASAMISRYRSPRRPSRRRRAPPWEPHSAPRSRPPHPRTWLTVDHVSRHEQERHDIPARAALTSTREATDRVPDAEQGARRRGQPARGVAHRASGTFVVVEQAVRMPARPSRRDLRGERTASSSWSRGIPYCSATTSSGSPARTWPARRPAWRPRARRSAAQPRDGSTINSATS